MQSGNNSMNYENGPSLDSKCELEEPLRLHHHPAHPTVTYPGAILQRDPCYGDNDREMEDRYSHCHLKRHTALQVPCEYSRVGQRQMYTKTHEGNQSTFLETKGQYETVHDGVSDLTHLYENKKINNTTSNRSNLVDNPIVELNPLDKVGSLSDECEKGNVCMEVKPTISYIGLIAKAILESSESRLSLGSIYSWIENNYPYYRSRGQGWRNSVRHNLSLNDCFIKAGRCEDGKGNYWAIHPANLQDFIRGDYRQRRRCRRRGRRKETGIYPAAVTGYFSPSSTPFSHGMPFAPPTAMNPLFSPYTEAERRAYRLDEALLRHSINNPFSKWYTGFCNPYHPPGPSTVMYNHGPLQGHFPDVPNPNIYHQFPGFPQHR